MIKYIIFALTTTCILLTQNVFPEEKDNIFCIDDCEPYHIAWVKDSSGDWVHVLTFEKAVVKTYFKNGPTTPNDIRFRLDKPPYKQTIEFKGYDLRFSSTDFSTEILEEGILCFCFIYDKEFKRGPNKYLGICISLMQGRTKTNDKYEYSLMPDYSNFQ